MNLSLKKENSNNISIVESFGKTNYFAAIKNSVFLLGNTSSGIIEAASFGKYVLNVGKRQHGRTRSKNIIDVDFDKKEILKNSKLLLIKSKYKGKNNYKMKNTSVNILSHTLNYLNR
jgi:GDP/UDP-N,N'-diacetylbacillosamine 2-epimerase (hydrolysing)